MCLSVSVLSKSCLSSESHFGYLGEVTKIHLAASYGFFGGDLGIFEANLYTSWPPGLEIAVVAVLFVFKCLKCGSVVQCGIMVHHFTVF